MFYPIWSIESSHKMSYNIPSSTNMKDITKTKTRANLSNILDLWKNEPQPLIEWPSQRLKHHILAQSLNNPTTLRNYGIRGKVMPLSMETERPRALQLFTNPFQVLGSHGFRQICLSCTVIPSCADSKHFPMAHGTLTASISLFSLA